MRGWVKYGHFVTHHILPNHRVELLSLKNQITVVIYKYVKFWLQTSGIGYRIGLLRQGLVTEKNAEKLSAVNLLRLTKNHYDK